MARLYVPPDKLTGNQAVLGQAEHRHLVKVLRLRPGSIIHLFDGAGVEIDACIQSIGKATVEVSLGQRRQIASPACAVTLLQVIPKGERMDLIVQKTTELGVNRIVPVLSEHGMVKPPPARRRRWQTIAAEASRQSGRADVPAVDEPMELRSALAHFADSDDSRFVLWEGTCAQSLRQALSSCPVRVVLVVGPEGGFAEQEVEACHRAAFVPVSLGPRILRTETAAMVAVALAQAAAGGLD